MIGLGSNRLTVCRRGGMAITQAGRGGMEWLAGGRWPRWSTPYSAQATAALKDAYPDLWTTLRDFGFRNPDKVPFINQYPLVAPYLLNDGLVLMNDCSYECSADNWKDIIGDRNFAGTNTVLTDGIPTFNGNAFYKHDTQLDYPRATHTIEAVFDASQWTGHLFDNTLAGVGIYLTGSRYLPISTGSGKNAPHFATIIGANNLITVAAANDTMFENLVGLTAGSRDYWGTTTTGTFIGGSRFKFKGKIYAIRIYNRLLTEQEILANQAIDLRRWQAT